MCKSVIKRKNQLIASENFNQFTETGLGKPHRLYGDFNFYYGITVSANVRLIVKPKTIDLSTESLKNCDIIILKGVVDYHGEKINWIIY